MTRGHDSTPGSRVARSTGGGTDRVTIGPGGRPRSAAVLALVLIVSLLSPRGSESAGSEARRTVVVVPGITGVELLDSETEDLIWGRGGNLLGPTDGGYRLAVPIGGGRADRSRPGNAIDRIRIGPITKPIYGPVARQFQRHGWTSGDLRRPEEGGDLFFFAYDWRRDNVQAASQLARQLERLASSRGDQLAVSLICQSNGAHICRYLVRYGSATLDEAENGERRLPAGVSFEQLVLVGTANGGSLRILRQLNQTRRYLPIGRRFHPEIFFTYESLYQDLPSYRDDLFVDTEGRDLAVDLWNVASWERYGWSIFDEEVRGRLDRRTDLFGNAEQQRRFLELALDRGRRLQALLKRDLDIGRTRYFMIQNQALPTPDRAVLRPTASGWETLITGDRALRQLAIASAVASSGDGHAPTASQRWLTPSETAALDGPPLMVDGRHFEMILRPPVLARLLEICSRPMETDIGHRTGEPGRRTDYLRLTKGPG